jgi:hypothetical protein
MAGENLRKIHPGSGMEVGSDMPGADLNIVKMMCNPSGAVV